MEITSVISLYVRRAIEGGNVTDEQLVQSLVDQGCPESDAINASQFVPVAFGRQFLDGMGIFFPDRYWAFSPSGEVVEDRALSSNPWYTEAKRLAPSLLTRQAVQGIAFRSSEVNTVNKALHGGSDAKNLAFAPVAFFLGEPSQQGIETAQQHIKSFLQGLTPKKAPRPWWRFW